MAFRIWSRTVASTDLRLSRQASDCVSGKKEVCPRYQPPGQLLVVAAESVLPRCSGPSGLCSVSRSCLTFCHPNGLQHPRLQEFAQTRVLWVGDVIQPSHPPSPPSPLILSLSQHQGLFQWVGSWHQVARLLELQLQYQSFQWLFKVDFLENWLVCCPCSPRDSQESSPAPQFGNINSLVLNLLYGPTLTTVHDYWKNHGFDCMELCRQSNVSAWS